MEPVASRPSARLGAALSERAAGGRNEAAGYLSAVLAGASVVVVDSRELERGAIRSFLLSVGAVVLPAGDSSQAFAIVEAVKPDLIRCDVATSVLERHSLVDRVRREPWGATVAVLGIAAEPVGHAPLARAGFDGLLVSPFGHAGLASAVQEMVRKRPEWHVRQRERLRERARWLRVESAEKQGAAEVARINASAAPGQDRKARRPARPRSRFRFGKPGAVPPRYRPKVLGPPSPAAGS